MIEIKIGYEWLMKIYWFFNFRVCNKCGGRLKTRGWEEKLYCPVCYSKREAVVNDEY